MKRLIPLVGLSLALLAGVSAHGQIVIIADNYDDPGNGTGFALGSGVNSGINPPTTTRLTGTAAAGLRYIQHSGSKPDANHLITDNKFSIVRPSGGGATTVTLSSGVGPFNFSLPLRAVNATPELPSVYEIRLKMASTTRPGNQRFSFGLASDPGGTGAWDFGLQLTRPDQVDGVQQEDYLIQRRIDMASTGGFADLDTTITNLPVGSYGTELSFLIKVTDAGTEDPINNTFNSRVQVSLDDGVTWLYDTQGDTNELPSGFRFDTAGRYFFWDTPGFGAGTYDDFSVTFISGPAASVTQTWDGGGTDDNWSTGGNWLSGEAPVNGDKLIFNGTTRPVNFNNIDALTVPWLAFNNGGFDLTGNTLTFSSAVTNLAGTNTLSLGMSWESASVKSWEIAADSELKLAGATAIDVNGNHTIRGGGTLRIVNTFQMGGASTANPAFEIADGRLILDGPSANLSTRGGFRMGVPTTGATVSETILTNGANFYISLAAGAVRVGDSANGLTNRLIIDNSTLTMSLGDMGVPWDGNTTAEVIQNGGLLSGCDLNFNQSGAGFGTYYLTGGVLEPRQIARNNAGGSSSIYFDNAILRTYLEVANPFMSGLDVAEIQSGGLTLDVTTADIVISQALSGAGGLTKSGGSAAVLTGANTYAGNTVVQSGRLMLPTTQTSSAAVQVSDFAEFGVIVTDPTASLQAGSLSMGSSSILNFDLSTFANPSAPLMDVTSLSASGPITVNVSGGSILMTPGTITLVKYTGAIGGGGNFVVGTLPAHLTAELVNNAGSLDLVISGVQGFLWTGASNSDWDLTTQNWLNFLDNSPSLYQDNFVVQFRDGATTGNINIPGSVFPTAMLVDNTDLAYAVTGGAINTALISKQGTNTFTRNDGVSDVIAELELNEGAFVANATFDATFATTLTDVNEGDGSFVKRGAGVLTVTSTNTTYGGAIVVEEGTFKVGATGALGSTNTIVTIKDGASLDVNNLQSPHVPVVVSGTGYNGQGAIMNSAVGGGVQNNLTDVEMVGDTTFSCIAGSRWDIRIRAGTGVGPGLRANGFNLTKTGGGSLSISSQRHDYGGLPVPYWEMNIGDILVSEGNLAIEESVNVGDPSKTITMLAGTSMNFFDLGMTNPLARNFIVTDAIINCGGQATHTNILNGNIAITGSLSSRPNNAMMIYNGVMSGDASFNISAGGTGRVFLNGVNTYTGDTTVTNGTLGGGGSIAGNLVMLGGILSPGADLGTFTVNGNATLAGDTLIELNPGQSPNSDQLSVGGTLAFGGTLTVVLADGAAAPQAGDVYQLFNKGSVSAFSGISLPDISALPGGLTWNTDNLAVNGTVSVVGVVTQPTIGTVGVSDGNFVFTGTGGVEGGTYHVITSPDVAAPIATWIPVATNVFGPGGTFSFTNVIGAETEAFFQVVIPAP